MDRVGGGFRTMVRNGRSTKFWKDVWLDETPLKNVVNANIEESDIDILVADMWENGRGWRWEKLRQILPEEYHDKLAMVHLETEITAADEVYWSAENSGKFTVSSAYDFICNNNMTMQENKWEKIWKLKVPAKMQTLLWLIYHRRIMCNAERMRRGLISSARCPKCGNSDETIEHIFRECPMAEEVWKALLSNDSRHNLVNLDMERWMIANIGGAINSNHGDKWPIVFAITIWWLWRWRNDFAFTGKETNLLSKIELIIEYSREVDNAFDKLRRGGDRTKQDDTLVSWKHPGGNTVVLNIDGSWNARSKKAGCGGVLRDYKGNWLGGFTSKLKVHHAVESEAWGLHKGLEWAWNKGFQNIEVQMDSQEVVRWIESPEQLRGPLRNVIHDCHQWMNKSWTVKIKHIYREQNAVADGLAKLAMIMNSDWNEWHEIPPMVHEIVCKDQEGIPQTRRITGNSN